MEDLPGSSSSTAEPSHAAEHLPDSAAIPSISTQGTTYTRPAPQASHADEVAIRFNSTIFESNPSKYISYIEIRKLKS